MFRVHSVGLGLSLCMASAYADIISGVVTDFDGGAPVAGAKISVSANVATLSGADGSYALNTAATGVWKPKMLSRSGIWFEGATGTFYWDESYGAVRIEVRDLQGWLADRFDSRSASSATNYRYQGRFEGVHVAKVETQRGNFRFRIIQMGEATLAVLEDPANAKTGNSVFSKGQALNNLSYEKSGYDKAVQQINGSQSNINVKLKKVGGTQRQANLTWFESYPDPGSPECIQFNGCQWAGMFAALNGKQPESWVMANNIAAVHSRDFNTYKLKTLRLQQGFKQIDVKVYDMCSDSDCNGCCTQNASSTGFLIDVEKYTRERFGTGSGTVNWMCLDC